MYVCIAIIDLEIEQRKTGDVKTSQCMTDKH